MWFSSSHISFWAIQTQNAHLQCNKNYIYTPIKYLWSQLIFSMFLLKASYFYVHSLLKGASDPNKLFLQLWLAHWQQRRWCQCLCCCSCSYRAVHKLTTPTKVSLSSWEEAAENRSKVSIYSQGTRRWLTNQRLTPTKQDNFPAGGKFLLRVSVEESNWSFFSHHLLEF